MLSRSCEKLRARFFKLRRKLNRTTFSTILLGKLLRLPIETVLSVLNKRDPNFSKKKNGIRIVSPDANVVEIQIGCLSCVGLAQLLEIGHKGGKTWRDVTHHRFTT